MSFVSLPFVERPLKPLTALLALALVFGTLDIVDAMCFWGLSMDVGPIHIFQGIASGLLGSAAYHGGIATAVLGAAIQYCAFFCMLGIYYLILMNLPALARRPYTYGLLYGLAAYIVVHYLILPMSLYHVVAGFYLAGFINTIVAQTVFVGIACAFLAHELHSKENSPAGEASEVQHASPSH
jgi:hypothetical protein